jgi:copper transport protein
VPAGDRQMRLDLRLLGPDQQPTDPKEVDASVRLPARSIGPLPVALSVAGPGHRTGTIAVPMTGSWQLAVTVRTTAIDEATGYLTLPIR